MQYVLRYDIEPTKHQAYRDWVKVNDSDIREHAAEGWHYLGTWFTVRGFGDYSAESRWEIDGYGSLGAGWGDAVGQRLAQEWFGFVDSARPLQASLYKGIDEVEVLPGT